MKKKKSLLGGVSAFLLSIFSASPGAQAPANDSAVPGSRGIIEEVVVTARKREESLRDVPVSITAFSLEEVERYDVVDIQSIEFVTNSLTIDLFGALKTRPAIRGLGADSTSPGQEFTTAMFLDGIYQSTGGMAAVPVYDVERVEVLKGPQGTLWGKNVVGGGVNVITAKPRDHFEAKVLSTVAEHGQFDLFGMYNNRISDTVSHRLAINIKTLEGYAKNVRTGDDSEDVNQKAFRYSLRAEPSDTLSVDWNFDWSDDDGNGRAGHTIGAKPYTITGEPITSGRSQVWAAIADMNLDPRETTDSDPGFHQREMSGTRLELNWGLSDSTTLTSVSAYRQIEDGWFHQDDGNDRDDPGLRELADSIVGGRVYDFGLGTSDDANQLSTELRLSGIRDSLTWTTGIFFSTEEYDQVARFFAQYYDCDNDPVGTTDGSTCSDRLNDELIDMSSATDDMAVFGEVTWSINDRWNLTAGARYTNVDKEGSWINNRSTPLTINGVAQADGLLTGAILSEPLTDSASYSNTTWRLVLDYHVTDDVMLYASVSTGFKPGGWAALTNSSNAGVGNFSKEETIDSYEVGMKGSFFDNRSNLNLTLFSAELEGLQVGQAGTTGIFAAVDTVETKGVELESVTSVTDNFFIDIKYTYLDTLLRGWPTAPTLDFVLQRAPENDVSTHIRYEYNLNEGGLLEFGVGHSYRGKVWDDPDNSSGEIRPARTLWDAHLIWFNGGGDWKVKLWGKNLSDEIYFNRITDTFDGSNGNLGPPRTFGVTVNKEYF